MSLFQASKRPCINDTKRKTSYVLKEFNERMTETYLLIIIHLTNPKVLFFISFVSTGVLQCPRVRGYPAGDGDVCCRYPWKSDDAAIDPECDGTDLLKASLALCGIDCLPCRRPPCRRNKNPISYVKACRNQCSAALSQAPPSPFPPKKCTSFRRFQFFSPFVV